MTDKTKPFLKRNTLIFLENAIIGQLVRYNETLWRAVKIEGSVVTIQELTLGELNELLIGQSKQKASEQ